MSALAQELAALSAGEMVAALGVRGGPSFVRRGLALPFLLASQPLARTLAAFDSGVADLGLPAAAGRALESFGVILRFSGAAASSGPCLVLANHPGAYDALALMRALGRQDLLILAADREFLRALPGLSAHLLFVGEQAPARAGALKRALRWLKGGGAVLHFPAGAIEPDADFESDAERWLAAWQPGVAALVQACARAGGVVLAAGVRGVHSPRAKSWRLNRLAERRGITTISPLLQLVARLRDVEARVCCQQLSDAATLAQLPPEALLEQLRAGLRQAIAAASRAA